MWRGHWLCIRIYFLALWLLTVYFVLKIRITYHIIHFDCKVENRIVWKKMNEKSRQIDGFLWKLMENENVKKVQHTFWKFICFLFSRLFFSYHFSSTNFSILSCFLIFYASKEIIFWKFFRSWSFSRQEICCFCFFTFSKPKLMFV